MEADLYFKGYCGVYIRLESIQSCEDDPVYLFFMNREINVYCVDCEMQLKSILALKMQKYDR